MDTGGRPEAVSLIRGNLGGQLVNQNMNSSQEWRFFGSRVPKAEIVYICQISIVYIIIITSIANLSINNGNAELWISLLCSAIGYALPSPTLSDGRTLPVSTQRLVKRSLSV